MDKSIIESYPRYESYKDSGYDWIGQVPSNWKDIPNKYVFNIINNKVGKKSDNYVLLSLTLQGIIKRDMINAQGKFPAEFDTYQEVKKNDFVFCLFDVEETPRTVGLSDYDGMITGAYTVFRAYSQFDERFIYYYYLNLDLDKRFKPLYRGLRNTIPKDWFMSFKTYFPNKMEQTGIAKFLDEKTLKIDKAIELKQQQIKKLEEYKQIVIQNAVTKGLNPDAPMKDSGFDWIGEIPKHWRIERFKYCFKFQRGLNITKDNLKDSGIPCLNYGEIHSKYGFELLPHHPLNHVEDKYLKTNSQSLLRNGDFVFADTSEDIEGSGNFSYLNGSREVFAGYHTLVAKPIVSFESRYIAYLLESQAFRRQVWQRVKGVKVYSITQAILKDTCIWLPPINEQKQIVKKLDSDIALINKSVEGYLSQIQCLKEYKTVLINEAVTGKIKVA